MDLQTFTFDGATLRAVEIDGQPYLVGKDVAERLGYANPNKAMNDHCKGVTKRYPLQTAGGTQEVRVLAEPDVLRLIVKSNLPAAERFERLVFEEILPTIRRTGSFGTPSITAEGLLANPRQLLALTQGYALQIEDMRRDIAGMQQDVEAFDRIANADGTFGIREAAKALKKPEREFVEWLRRNNWCYRPNGRRGLLGYAETEKRGFLTHKVSTFTKPDGSEGVQQTVRITTAGLTHLAKRFSLSQFESALA